MGTPNIREAYPPIQITPPGTKGRFLLRPRDSFEVARDERKIDLGWFAQIPPWNPRDSDKGRWSGRNHLYDV